MLSLATKEEQKESLSLLCALQSPKKKYKNNKIKAGREGERGKHALVRRQGTPPRWKKKEASM